MAVEIMTREDLALFKKELFEELKKMFAPQETVKPWLRSYEVKKLLNVSSGTLLSLRAKGILPYSRIGASMFYKYEDVVKAMEKGKGK